MIITTRQVRLVVGCLVWAALAQVAINPVTDNTELVWGVRIALPLLAGFALTRRYRDWPAAITMSTISAVLVGIDTIRFLVPVIGATLSFPAGFIAAHQHDEWAQRYPDGPPLPGLFWPIVLSLVVGLIVAVVVWFPVAGGIRLGMQVRTWTGQLIGLARPSQRPASSGGRNAPNSTG